VYNSGMEDNIIVKGARTHNLQNITVEMPRNKMVVITGLSGSGKSSLAFDTIFAEGQRRYVESLSAYARQFLNQMQKPDVDEIAGLSPAISIDQKSRSNNPRSTVATITEIYDYLRILYARVGTVYCPNCGEQITKLSREEMLDMATSVVLQEQKGKKKKAVMGVEYDDSMVRIFAPVVVGRKGEYYQMLYDLIGKGYEKVRIDDKEHSLRDQIELKKNKRHSISVLVDELYVSEFSANSKEARERLAEAIEQALHESSGLVELHSPDGAVHTLSANFTCGNDGTSFPEVEPRLFSFNSPYGACSGCNGLGMVGVLQDEICAVCHGARLRQEALQVRLGGTKAEGGKNIVEYTALSVDEALTHIQSISLTKKQQEIASVVLKEIISRLTFLKNVGLEYLTLDRRANTLSGGEAQRIRLASQLGSGLVGALYVLDEPTIGLHQRDNARLIKTLTALRDLGNTIIVVEHDEDTIFAADYIIDIGPGAGVHGGKVVVSGWLEELLTAEKNTSKSRTLAYLRGEEVIEIPDERRSEEKGWVRIRDGNAFNIKKMNADIPLGRMTAITGVSGSGKSTFLYELLFRNLRARLERQYRTNTLYNISSITGTEYLSRVVLIDQSPIGRTPRSNPATYTGAWTYVRELFAATNEAKARGWKPSRFSFNVPQQRGGGRCEACQGNGTIAVEMHFLPTVYVECDVCSGKRFTKDTLEVRYKKKSIYDVLNMTVEEALDFFGDIPQIADRLSTLMEVGLGYLELGQSANTLSGGEAQRVKISSELYRPHTQKTIYLLDEPTVGLHYDDIAKLLDILQRLVNKGHTVVLIEHNMDVIKSTDWIIDIGPEGGVGGGKVVAQGTPEKVAKAKGSYTGEWLKKVL
jgi:excinuclease ABC subunit A